MFTPSRLILARQKRGLSKKRLGGVSRANSAINLQF